jgi:hypothetical protein
MPDVDAVNDNAPLLDTESLGLDEVLAKALGDPRLENVVGAAVLVATAFRLRDEDALILTLRRLTDAVDALEEAADAEMDERRAACG